LKAQIFQTILLFVFISSIINGCKKEDEQANKKPQTDFSCEQKSYYNGEEVSFTDLTTDEPVLWFWQFGDGSTSKLQHPVHIYDYEGSYSVSLSTNNDYGSSSITKNEYIQIAANPELPQLSTVSISSITDISAQCEVIIISDGGNDIIRSGVCWSTSFSSNILYYHSELNSRSPFVGVLSDLLPKTTYFVRGFATTIKGTSYGNELHFTTLEGDSIFGAPCPDTPTVTDYDGNIYNTVRIGEQCWMKENLKTTHYADGAPVKSGYNAGDLTEKLSAKYYFNYDNNENNVHIYGRLYTWSAAVNGVEFEGWGHDPDKLKGICPDGWHVPSDKEWRKLSMYLGLSREEADNSGYRGRDEGGKLKETRNIHWNEFNEGASNESGFTALAAGWRTPRGFFNNKGTLATFWSSTLQFESCSWFHYLHSDNSMLGRNSRHYKRSTGMSVRCVKD